MPLETTLQEDLRDTLSDWTIIDTPKRLRGCLLHCARLHRRHGEPQKAASIEARVKAMPKAMDKEAINLVLMAASIEFGLI